MKPIVAYVVGSAHSGSTLLDVLVGSHSAATSGGELLDLGDVHPKGCLCGARPFQSCAFWRGVDAELRASAGVALAELDVRAADAGRFARDNAALYAAIAATSGRRVVVDSSKSVPRLARLFEAGLDVRPLYLVRDPRGVVFSELRKGRPLWGAARRWRALQRRARRLLAGRPHVVLRYEELATEPLRALAPAMRTLGLEVEPGQLDWHAHARHSFSGNHMRRALSSAIRLDLAWRTGLSRAQQLAVLALVAGSGGALATTRAARSARTSAGA